MATPKDGCNVTTDSPSPFTTNEMPASDALLASASVINATSLTPTAAAVIQNNAIAKAQLPASTVGTPFSPSPCVQLFNNSATESDTIDESNLGIGLFSMPHHNGCYESVLSATRHNQQTIETDRKRQQTIKTDRKRQREQKRQREEQDEGE